jgi:BCD family chlorophyll transporter-like MFS transporter
MSGGQAASKTGGKRGLNATLAQTWVILGPRFLPFADAASQDLPLPRLLRLSLFQISVGMAVVLLTGTLNRVMIVELGVPTWLVALMVSLPLLFAPFRALIGFKSDNHRSFLGWRRVPYIWMGTLIQFGGLAIMPFALLVLSGDATNAPEWLGPAGAALAFLLVGAGLHTTQTAGLALATDLAPEDKRPRVVALLYVTLLIGMVGTSLVFGYLLRDFTQVQLIQVIQGAAVVTMALNVVALWKQEGRNPLTTRHDAARPDFRTSWRDFVNGGRATRVLVATGLGTAAFSMQDVLLEPYGGEILGLTVGQTTMLTALLAGGSLVGFGLAARRLGRGSDPYRLASLGLLAGLVAFSAVIFAEPLGSANLFRAGTFLIGFGGGLFAVTMLTASMYLARDGQSGLALGAWGAVVATATGLAVGLGGAIRDIVTKLAVGGALGPAMTGPEVGYSVVYHLEIALLFATLVAIGPLVRTVRSSDSTTTPTGKFGLNEFPA